LETLYQFGVELGFEIEDRIRYAKWKASDIVRAINEGRVPQAGAPIPTTTITTSMAPVEASVKEEELDTTPTVASNLPSMSGSYEPSFVNKSSPPASTPTVPQSPPAQPKYTSPPPPPPPPAAPAPSVRSSSTSSSSSLPFLTFDQAEKHCRYAVSAIQFEDALTAIKEMETAIKILKSIQP